MSKKSDAYYFETFVKCSNYGLEAAKLLDKSLKNYDPKSLHDLTEQIHEIEHKADEERHKLTERLAKEFVTPIEREDIVTLSHRIDNLVDHIEDVLMRMYCDNITSVRHEILEVSALLIESCKETVELVKDLPRFKKSDDFMEHIIRINEIEGQADVLYIKNMRQLHTTEKDVLTILVWRDVYTYLEKCHDDCEDIASEVESIILKNS